ncbi:hypothetical protein RHI9324_05509 [Rhizobium sp. CECT 9324]|nr:hypothetical protein RHI9324_05509 [Rhizobium sp. CECT 9324]
MWSCIEKNRDAYVSWYLMLSYLYYQLDITILPDEDYNTLCVKLIKELPSIAHRHRHLVDEDSLRAGTGYSITEYPTIAMSAAIRLAKEDRYLQWNKKRRIWEKRT